MSYDIVADLRGAAADNSLGIGAAWNLLAASADEIERLRKALDDIAKGMCPGSLLDNLPGESQAGEKGIFQERFAGWMQRTAAAALGAEDAL